MTAESEVGHRVGSADSEHPDLPSALQLEVVDKSRFDPRMADVGQAEGALVRGRLIQRAHSGQVTRRKLLGWTGVGIASTAFESVTGHTEPGTRTAGSATVPESIMLVSSISSGSDITVPPPTGVPGTDTANILKALSSAAAGSAVIFQASATAVYAIDQELPVPRGVHLTGTGVAGQSSDGSTSLMPTLQQAAGTSLHCIAGSASYLAGLYGPMNPGKYPTYNALYGNGKQHHFGDSAIEIDHLAFDGQNGGTGTGNTAGHGVVLLSNGSSVHDCFFLDVANAAVVAADLNWAGVPCGDPTSENRIVANTIVNPSWFGIWITNTAGSAGCTDGVILNNIIVSPSQQRLTTGPVLNPSTVYLGSKGVYSEGLHLANAAGWWVAENHLEACPGTGIFANTTWGLHLVGNTVDGFGCYPTAHAVLAGLNIVTAGQEKTHPGFIIGNLVTAYEGANPFAPATPAPSTATFEYFKVTMQNSAGRKVEASYHSYLVEADNVAHQASQLPAPIAGASISAGNPMKVVVPNGSTSGVQVGMGIADNLGLIPAGAKVKQIVPGVGTALDAILLTVAATPGTGDTVSFTGPTSIGWTYVNSLFDSILQVNRTNETTTGTIQAQPVISITTTPPPVGSTVPVITIIDPAERVGSLQFTPTIPPSPGQVLVAAAGSASWKSVTVPLASEAPAGGVLSGAYPAPVLSPDAVTVISRSGSVALPPWATTFRVTCVGGGGGGGGGASGLGGGGGAAGTTVEHLVNAVVPATMTVTVGDAGVGGAAGAGTANGTDGAAGGSTVVGLGGFTLGAPGGPGGSGAASGTTPTPGGAYGGSSGTTSPVGSGSGGGASGQAGGDPFSFSPGGGGGGGGATALRGGSGGGSGAPDVGGAAGATGASTNAVGRPGSGASAPGAGGGGGGGGSSAAAGGAGGEGSGGFVIVEVVR